MSILLKNNDGWIISHESCLENIYKEVNYFSKPVKFSFNDDLFGIYNPFMTDAHLSKINSVEQTSSNKKKRKRNNDKFKSLIQEVDFIKRKIDSLLSDNVRKQLFVDISNCVSSNNLEARTASKLHFHSMEKEYPVFQGGNKNDFSIVVDIFNKSYILPSKCDFFSCDVLQLADKLEEGKKFDFILLDPPWWNKYIRRKHKKVKEESYKMMYNSDISKIPVNSFIKEDGLVAVWCTNALGHLNSLKEDIFPSWGLQYISSWFWVKVTKKGETVCQFSEPPGKQPYERIVFGSRLDRSKVLPQPQENKIILSVPSAIHSHKPPIIEIIDHVLPESPSCLELFARYLLPGWTSCGNQVLSLQEFSLYSMHSIS